MKLIEAFEYLGNFKKEDFAPDSLSIMPEKWIKDVIDVNSQEFTNLVQMLENLSNAPNCAIVPGSISLKEDGNVYNASPLILSGHLLGWQKKISLFKIEKKTYSPGRELSIFQIARLKLGVAVCYDIDFPYYAKKLVSLGCDIIVNPSLIHSDFTDMWHLYIKARALENRIPIISVNSISYPFLGNSIAADPYSSGSGARLREHICGSDYRSVFTINPEDSQQIRRDRFNEDPGDYELASYDHFETKFK
ncbi:carbon-nitrogen hydrolase family protein [Oxyplasma meridianum]|uniref:Carbon-nitrogen hydrolase family protein n=1 Tax=Oxyplasma meridianum TaxID=3073602 RepID=A0AAX4NGU8_9ARCH